MAEPVDLETERKRKQHEQALRNMKNKEDDEAAQNAGLLCSLTIFNLFGLHV